MRLPAPNGAPNSPINAGFLAECPEQLVVDTADDAEAVVRAIGKNRAASALASDAINRAAIIAASGQGLLHRHDQGVIIVDDVAAINGRISPVIRIRIVVIIVRKTIPVAVTIKGRTDPTIIAMMPMMPATVMLVIAMMPIAVLLVPAMISAAVLLLPPMIPVPAAMSAVPAAVLSVPAMTAAAAMTATAMTAAPALSVSLGRHRQARKRHYCAADQARKLHDQTLHEKKQAQLPSGATSF